MDFIMNVKPFTIEFLWGGNRAERKLSHSGCQCTQLPGHVARELWFDCDSNGQRRSDERNLRWGLDNLTAPSPGWPRRDLRKCG